MDMEKFKLWARDIEEWNSLSRDCWEDYYKTGLVEHRESALYWANCSAILLKQVLAKLG